MFEKLLSSAKALRRHQDGPLATERERYLQHCSEVDLEMKAKALASVDVSGQPAEPLRQHALPSLMTFLRGI